MNIIKSGHTVELSFQEVNILKKALMACILNGIAGYTFGSFAFRAYNKPDIELLKSLGELENDYDCIKRIEAELHKLSVDGNKDGNYDHSQDNANH